MERYRDICEFYQDGSPVWRLLGIFTPKEMERLCSFSLEDAEKILQTSEKRGHAVLAIDQEEYPEALKEIDNPPCVLYCKGEFPDFNRLPALAIVGTRKATQSGRRVAHQFAYELAKTGMIIVSGGALGIDAAAHQGEMCIRDRDMIFRALSHNEENLFMVGDVKQSIYRFRQAMPEIFLRRKGQYAPYREAHPEFPACITLEKNFRSRAGVTAGINFVFRQLMSRQMGELDYEGSEELIPGAVYPDPHPDTSSRDNSVRHAPCPRAPPVSYTHLAQHHPVRGSICPAV